MRGFFRAASKRATRAPKMSFMDSLSFNFPSVNADINPREIIRSERQFLIDQRQALKAQIMERRASAKFAKLKYLFHSDYSTGRILKRHFPELDPVMMQVRLSKDPSLEPVFRNYNRLHNSSITNYPYTLKSHKKLPHLRESRYHFVPLNTPSNLPKGAYHYVYDSVTGNENFTEVYSYQFIEALEERVKLQKGLNTNNLTFSVTDRNYMEAKRAARQRNPVTFRTQEQARLYDERIIRRVSRNPNHVPVQVQKLHFQLPFNRHLEGYYTSTFTNRNTSRHGIDSNLIKRYLNAQNIVYYPEQYNNYIREYSGRDYLRVVDNFVDRGPIKPSSTPFYHSQADYHQNYLYPDLGSMYREDIALQTSGYRFNKQQAKKFIETLTTPFYNITDFDAAIAAYSVHGQQFSEFQLALHFNSEDYRHDIFKIYQNPKFYQKEEAAKSFRMLPEYEAGIYGTTYSQIGHQVGIVGDERLIIPEFFVINKWETGKNRLAPFRFNFGTVEPLDTLNNLSTHGRILDTLKIMSDAKRAYPPNTLIYTAHGVARGRTAGLLDKFGTSEIKYTGNASAWFGDGFYSLQGDYSHYGRGATIHTAYKFKQPLYLPSQIKSTGFSDIFLPIAKPIALMDPQRPYEVQVSADFNPSDISRYLMERGYDGAIIVDTSTDPTGVHYNPNVPTQDNLPYHSNYEFLAYDPSVVQNRPIHTDSLFVPYGQTDNSILDYYSKTLEEGDIVTKRLTYYHSYTPTEKSFYTPVLDYPGPLGIDPKVPSLHPNDDIDRIYQIVKNSHGALVAQDFHGNQFPFEDVFDHTVPKILQPTLTGHDGTTFTRIRDRRKTTTGTINVDPKEKFEFATNDTNFGSNTNPSLGFDYGNSSVPKPKYTFNKNSTGAFGFSLKDILLGRSNSRSTNKRTKFRDLSYSGRNYRAFRTAVSVSRKTDQFLSAIERVATPTLKNAPKTKIEKLLNNALRKRSALKRNLINDLIRSNTEFAQKHNIPVTDYVGTGKFARAPVPYYMPETHSVHGSSPRSIGRLARGMGKSLDLKDLRLGKSVRSVLKRIHRIAQRSFSYEGVSAYVTAHELGHAAQGMNIVDSPMYRVNEQLYGAQATLQNEVSQVYSERGINILDDFLDASTFASKEDFLLAQREQRKYKIESYKIAYARLAIKKETMLAIERDAWHRASKRIPFLAKFTREYLATKGISALSYRLNYAKSLLFDSRSRDTALGKLTRREERDISNFERRARKATKTLLKQNFEFGGEMSEESAQKLLDAVEFAEGTTEKFTEMSPIYNKIEKSLNRFSTYRRIVNRQTKLAVNSIKERVAAAGGARSLSIRGVKAAAAGTAILLSAQAAGNSGALLPSNPVKTKITQAYSNLEMHGADISQSTNPIRNIFTSRSNYSSMESNTMAPTVANVTGNPEIRVASINGEVQPRGYKFNDSVITRVSLKEQTNRFYTSSQNLNRAFDIEKVSSSMNPNIDATGTVTRPSSEVDLKSTTKSQFLRTKEGTTTPTSGTKGSSLVINPTTATTATNLEEGAIKKGMDSVGLGGGLAAGVIRRKKKKAKENKKKELIDPPSSGDEESLLEASQSSENNQAEELIQQTQPEQVRVHKTESEIHEHISKVDDTALDIIGHDTQHIPSITDNIEFNPETGLPVEAGEDFSRQTRNVAPEVGGGIDQVEEVISAHSKAEQAATAAAAESGTAAAERAEAEAASAAGEFLSKNKTVLTRAGAIGAAGLGLFALLAIGRAHRREEIAPRKRNAKVRANPGEYDPYERKKTGIISSLVGYKIAALGTAVPGLSGNARVYMGLGAAVGLSLGLGKSRKDDSAATAMGTLGAGAAAALTFLMTKKSSLRGLSALRNQLAKSGSKEALEAGMEAFREASKNFPGISKVISKDAIATEIGAGAAFISFPIAHHLMVKNLAKEKRKYTDHGETSFMSAWQNNIAGSKGSRVSNAPLVDYNTANTATVNFSGGISSAYNTSNAFGEY
jgi:hypothetical protein